MRLSYFFSKKECILGILERLIFKIFHPVGPNHGEASLVTGPQPPQSQKCGYGPEVKQNLISSITDFVCELPRK